MNVTFLVNLLLRLFSEPKSKIIDAVDKSAFRKCLLSSVKFTIIGQQPDLLKRMECRPPLLCQSRMVIHQGKK